MPNERLRSFLEENHVEYVTIRHSPVYTAQETAASAHVKGRNLAKTVIVRLDDHLVMAVLPAQYKVNLERLKEETGASSAELVDEDEFADRFSDCEPGAMPPFGNLYGIEVHVDRSLTEDEEIDFNAGSHSEIVQLPYGEYERLVHPRVESFIVP